MTAFIPRLQEEASKSPTSSLMPHGRARSGVLTPPYFSFRTSSTRRSPAKSTTTSARHLKAVAALQEPQDIIRILGMDVLSDEDWAVVSHVRKLQRFTSEPFLMGGLFTCKPDQCGELADTIR